MRLRVSEEWCRRGALDEDGEVGAGFELTDIRQLFPFMKGHPIMGIRCKMKLESLVPFSWGGAQAIFRCEYDPKIVQEDVGFQKATPSGEARFQIDNPKATEQLVIGGYYYVDFTAIPKAQPAST